MRTTPWLLRSLPMVAGCQQPAKLRQIPFLAAGVALQQSGS
jgi:hypothetical protein